MKLWEYQDVAVLKSDPMSTIPLLDEAGQQGWETTGIVEENHTYRMYLMKRPIVGQDARAHTPADLVKHSHSVRSRCTTSCPHIGTIHEITKVTY